MSWKRLMLGEVLEQVKTPVQIKKEKGYKLVTISNNGNIILRKLVMGSQISANKAFEAKKGTFIYSRLSVHNGAFGIVPEDLDGALITSEMPIFNVNANAIPDFLLYSLRLPSFKLQLNNLTKGMGRTRVKETSFLTLHIDLPAPELQKKIISNINKNEKRLTYISKESLIQFDILKKLRLQILQDAFQGKLVTQEPNDELASNLLERIKTERSKLRRRNAFQKDKPTFPIDSEEIPYEIPPNWVWCRFGEVVAMSRGRFSIRPRNDPRYFNGIYPFIQIGSLDERGSIINYSTQTLNELGAKVSKEFPSGTIAIAIVGGTIGNLGVLGKNMFFPDSIIGITPSSFYNQEYVLLFLRHKQPLIKSESYQMAGQPNIKIPTLFNLFFPLPSLTEQNRIVEKVKHLMKICDELENSIHKNQKYTQELLHVTLQEALMPENI